MTSNTTNLGASSPLPEGGKSLVFHSSGLAFGKPLNSNVRLHKNAASANRIELHKSEGSISAISNFTYVCQEFTCLG